MIIRQFDNGDNLRCVVQSYGYSICSQREKIQVYDFKHTSRDCLWELIESCILTPGTHSWLKVSPVTILARRRRNIGVKHNRRVDTFFPLYMSATTINYHNAPALLDKNETC